MVKITLEYPQLKKSLGAVDWGIKQVNVLSKNYSLKIKRAREQSNMRSFRKEYYGRISSVIKQINPQLKYLEASRKTMKRFPAIKTGLHTIAIAGYPNVGKSSLLRVLTEASPDIKEYAFTTKDLNMGYFKKDNDKIQVIDTPGAFDRDMSDMNNIEKQAYLILEHVAETVVFVVDPTETCGFPTKKQLALLRRVRAFEKKTVVVYNKADLVKHREQGRLYVSCVTKEGIKELINQTS